MSDLILIGAGGHGKVVADTAMACGYKDIIFLDDCWPGRKSNGQWPIQGKGMDAPQKLEEKFCSVGNNATRAKMFQVYALENSPTLVHPTAILSPSVKLGAGTLVVAGAIINTDSVVGQGTIINTACSIDHDCNIGDFSHISPGARLAGGVSVGAQTWIGIGAVVKEGINIGANVIVGAGAAVIRDIDDNTCVAGVPAQII